MINLFTKIFDLFFDVSVVSINKNNYSIEENYTSLYTGFPWYFSVNKLFEIQLLISEGKNTTINLIDNCIIFDHVAFGINNTDLYYKDVLALYKNKKFVYRIIFNDSIIIKNNEIGIYIYKDQCVFKFHTHSYKISMIELPTKLVNKVINSSKNLTTYLELASDEEILLTNLLIKDCVFAGNMRYHGTKVAGLIASSSLTLPDLNNPENQLTTMGIASKSRVKILDVGSTLNILTDELNNLTTITGQPFHFHNYRKELAKEIILINYSAFYNGNNTDQWKNTINSLCKSNIKMLIVLAAGNEYINVTKSDKLPQSLRFHGLEDCVDMYDTDPFIIVGAVNEYDKYDPIVSSISSYGSKYLDILAPGFNIPSLYNNSFHESMTGTSSSAAIVSGAIALICQCRKYNDSISSLKNLLLSNSYKNPSLKDYVKDGAVLNVFEAVKAACERDNNTSEKNMSGLQQFNNDDFI